MISSRRQASSVTVESIVELILREWNKDDLEFVKTRQHDFGQVSRAIRNDYGLWEFDHPLTQHWHMHPECRNIVDEIDYSEDHPDAVSAAILEALRERLGQPTSAPKSLSEILRSEDAPLRQGRL